MRETDDDDPRHGERAAGLFQALCADPGLAGFSLAADRTRAMDFALANHTCGTRADQHPNVNVGICWDADRLTLWRVGIRPTAAFLTTAVACAADTIDYGRELAEAQMAGRLPPWDEIDALRSAS